MFETTSQLTSTFPGFPSAFFRVIRLQDTQLHQHLDRIQAIDACLRRIGDRNTPIHQKRYMGVSENSVPLNLMVNDHYPC